MLLRELRSRCLPSPAIGASLSEPLLVVEHAAQADLYLGGLGLVISLWLPRISTVHPVANRQLALVHVLWWDSNGPTRLVILND